jgi:dienelactone hydrolase
MSTDGMVPDWDGVNAYKQERATALAELGYVAFAADIFGALLLTQFRKKVSYGSKLLLWCS